MLAGIGAFVGLEWSRVGQWLVALAFGGLAFAALGVAIGALAREVRAASLLSFLLSLPLAFLALVPAGAVAGGLYDAIRAISFVFPYKAALEALDAAVNRYLAGPGDLARAPVGADRAVRGSGPPRAAAAGLSPPARSPVGRHRTPLSSVDAGWARVSSTVMAFPQTRMRRLRASSALRGLVRETDLRAGQLVLPLFVQERRLRRRRRRQSVAPAGARQVVDLRRGAGGARGGAARDRGGAAVRDPRR